MFRFNLNKTIQAIGVLFREEHVNRMSYIRLIKLLYIAERESIKETGRPIIGDGVVAMDQGPVFSRVYDLVKGEAVGTDVWNGYLVKDHYHLELSRSPDVGELSRYEIDKLRQVSKRHEDHDDWEVVNVTHAFEEWRNNQPPKGSSKRIPFEDIVKAVGREKDLAAIVEIETDGQAYDKIFGS
jgi:uncharacterized phage-associated protein